jgi:type II secretory pathway pseudopilin PulG
MKAIVVATFLIAGAVIAQTNPPQFRDAESERRYYEALREKQRYEAERAYWDAYQKSLEQSDKRIFKPIREAAIEGVGHVAGTMGGPVVGEVAKETYRSALKDFANDPEYEAEKRKRAEERQRAQREYEEKQRRYWEDFNRGIQQQSQQMQRAVDQLYAPRSESARNQPPSGSPPSAASATPSPRFNLGSPVTIVIPPTTYTNGGPVHRQPGTSYVNGTATVSQSPVPNAMPTPRKRAK